MSRLRRRIGAFAAAMIAGTVVVGAPADATQNSQPVQSGSGLFTGYALSSPVCAVPRDPNEFACMAYRRIDVPKGTPGAHRYTIPNVLRGPRGGYTPGALAKAYGFDATSGGRGVTVGIVDWNNDPRVRADLNHFDRYYGFPSETASSFRVVNQNGKSAPLPAPSQSASVEIALDVQTVRAVCRHCRILLVEADAGRSEDLAQAENSAVRLGAKVVSNSFGAPERTGHPFPSNIVKAFHHPGVVITASSGDDGYFYWDLRNEDPFVPQQYVPHAASFPASLPTVVSVSGTTLKLNSDGTRKSESVWNSNGPGDQFGNNREAGLGGAGGGCSMFFKAPGWQHNLKTYKAAGCKGKRLVGDVAALGDYNPGFSIFDSYGSGGWAAIGGTSLSSPIIAGMWALAGGAGRLSLPGQALYQNRRFRPASLTDITEGGNGWCGGLEIAACKAVARDSLGTSNPNFYYGANVDCSFPADATAPKDPECNAVPGYDGASGVGTPNSLTAMRTTQPAVHISASNPRHPHQRITFTGHVRRVLGHTTIVRKQWYWGDHTDSVVSNATSVSHRFASKGRYQITLKVTDSAGQKVRQTRHVIVK